MNNPAMPTMERRRRIRKGFFPPVVSTQAEKGIRSRDPEREGAATRNPTSRGLRPMIPLRLFAVGPKRETAAKPMKNPKVAPARPRTGVPIVVKAAVSSAFIFAFRQEIDAAVIRILADPTGRNNPGSNPAREKDY